MPGRRLERASIPLLRKVVETESSPMLERRNDGCCAGHAQPSRACGRLASTLSVRRHSAISTLAHDRCQ